MRPGLSAISWHVIEGVADLFGNFSSYDFDSCFIYLRFGFPTIIYQLLPNIKETIAWHALQFALFYHNCSLRCNLPSSRSFGKLGAQKVGSPRCVLFASFSLKITILIFDFLSIFTLTRKYWELRFATESDFFCKSESCWDGAPIWAIFSCFRFYWRRQCQQIEHNLQGRWFVLQDLRWRPCRLRQLSWSAISWCRSRWRPACQCPRADRPCWSF